MFYSDGISMVYSEDHPFLLADHFDPNRPSVQATKPWGFPSVPPTSVATRQGLKQLDTSYNSNWWFQPPRKIWVRQIGSSSQLLGKIKVMFQTTNQNSFPNPSNLNLPRSSSPILLFPYGPWTTMDDYGPDPVQVHQPGDAYLPQTLRVSGERKRNSSLPRTIGASSSAWTSRWSCEFGKGLVKHSRIQ